MSSRNELGRTRLHLQVEGGRRDLLVDRDSTVAPKADATRIDIVALVPRVAIVLVDRYASLPGGLSFCQAGEEQFLRVVSIAKEQATETFTTKVASCRNNIELADRGLEWDADALTLRIHWLTGPQGKAEVRAIRVGLDGRAQVAQ